MATELEFKLAVPNTALLEQILFDADLKELRQEDYRLYDMATVYYDTPDRRLSQLCWTLRLRQENDLLLATVKTPKGAHERGEWECEAQRIQDAIPLLVEQGAPAELAAFADQPLHPVCMAQFTRRAANLKFPDGTVCELAGDVGVLMGGSKEEELCEIELELKEGNAELVEAYAAELMDRFDLQEEPRSKFARANALARH